ncbi:hypothetical protein BKA63DRAFT_411193 [Paraphoma chrysanthemicola]|nr:hypothetical protein BKA63DRAFT_411193 [Paraphoma chrysanthemicola]
MKLLLPFIAMLATASATTIRTLYPFSNSTWLENLALTSNSSLLVTVFGQIAHDVFAVAVGSITPSNSPIKGSFSIWSIDISNCLHPAKINKIVDLQNMSMVNGITLLNPSTLLLADSWAGNIVALDLHTQAYKVLVRDEGLKPDFNRTTSPLGVNGLRFHAQTSYLYYTNTVQNLLGRVKVDAHSGTPIAPFEIIARGGQVSGPDDFAVRRDGSVVLVRPIADSVQIVGLDGKGRKVGMVAGGTSVVLADGGRKAYVSTSTLVGGEVVGRGKVVEIKF